MEIVHLTTDHPDRLRAMVKDERPGAKTWVALIAPDPQAKTGIARRWLPGNPQKGYNRPYGHFDARAIEMGARPPGGRGGARWYGVLIGWGHYALVCGGPEEAFRLEAAIKAKEPWALAHVKAVQDRQTADAEAKRDADNEAAMKARAEEIADRRARLEASKVWRDQVQP